MKREKKEKAPYTRCNQLQHSLGNPQSCAKKFKQFNKMLIIINKSVEPYGTHTIMGFLWFYNQSHGSTGSPSNVCTSVNIWRFLISNFSMNPQ